MGGNSSGNARQKVSEAERILEVDCMRAGVHAGSPFFEKREEMINKRNGIVAASFVFNSIISLYRFQIIQHDTILVNV